MEELRNNYRTELKYVFDHENYLSLKRCLYALGFVRAHQSNVVNNIYFDYKNQNYQDNIDGTGIRIKSRIRWYNQFKKKCVLEEKIKIGMAGKKNRYDLIIHNIDDPEEVRQAFISATGDRQSTPNTRNQYLREYFVNNGVRVTLDSSLKFSKFNSNFIVYEPMNIMEMKFDNDRKNIDLSFINELPPLKYSKYSKYQKSLEYLGIDG